MREVAELDQEKILDQIRDIAFKYAKVKDAYIQVEYKVERKYLLTCANELRSAYDHIMRIFDEDESFEQNINRAEGHTLRAGYDAYETWAQQLLSEIYKIRERFSIDIISKVYPEYHQRLIPEQDKLHEKLAQARKHKQENLEADSIEEEEIYFNEYRNIVDNLVEIRTKIYKHIQGMIELEEEKKRTSRKNTIITISASIGGAILGVILTLIFG